jgi:hypothetical protein
VDVLCNLGPPSAGATLLQRGLQLDFPRGVGTVTLPAILNDAANILFFDETLPMQVRDYTLAAGATLLHRKAGCIVCFTQEMFRYSIPAIESLTRSLVGESLNLKIDSHMLDTVADDGIRPQGLLKDIVGITAAGAGDFAMFQDVAALAGAVSAVAGNGPIVLVGSPKQAARMKLSRDVTAVHEVLNSPALADKTVVAVAANALVSVSGGPPRFDVDTGSTLHMATTPAALATGGGPTIATPIRALWQTDTVGLRIVFDINWALRSTSGIALVTNVNW